MNGNFFKIFLLAFSTPIPVSFPLVKAPLKHMYRDNRKLHCVISFNVLYILKSEISV